MRRSPLYLVVAALVAYGCSPTEDGEPTTEAPPQAAAGDEAPADGKKRAPDLVLQTVDGSDSIALADQRGKVVLVDLWATWCVPCIAELPHLQEMSEQLDADDFLMLGVVLESGERDEIESFLADQDIDYPQVIGEDADRDAFGPFLGYPTKYLIDREGLVVKRYFGIVGEQLAADVETLVQTGVLEEKSD